MAGEKIVQQALRYIKNLKGEKVSPPTTFYRGTNPNSTERITTGKPDWDSYLFAADNVDDARLYGSNIETIKAKPDAKILYQGTKDWNSVVGRWKNNESLLDYANRAANSAREAGYDAAWFNRQGDVGTSIFNPDAFVRNYSETPDVTKASGGSVRDEYAGGGVIEKALKAVRELNPLGLFSRATEEAAKIPQAKGTPTQMRAALLKQGVKPDELKWTGFDDWIKDKQSVTRDEVADFLRRNQVRVEETRLGGGNRLDAIARDMYGQGYTSLTEQQAANVNNAARRGRVAEDAPPTKFEQYTFPGGENYRELLLKQPSQQRRDYAFEWFDPATQRSSSQTFYDEASARAAAPEGSIISRREVAETNPDYRSSHWSEPNVLAHLRLKDRTDPQGRRILHVEEIQSDWAQEGRKKGFAGPEIDLGPLIQRMEETRQRSADAARAMISRETGGQYNSLRDVLDSGDRDLLARVRQARQDPELLALHQQATEAEQALSAARNANRDRVPTAPFVESTPKWTDLALKRALREAVEGNYDALAWTPGAQQAARYDLRKQVARVEYNDKTGALTAFDPEGRTIILERSVTPDQLPNYIGQEPAQRILGSQPTGGVRRIEGTDLSVGGEGMIGYYDKIVPTQLQKLVRPMDPEARIGSVEISNPARPSTSGPEIDNLYRELAGEEPPAMVGGMNERLPSLNITPAMREKIKEGLPLFTMVPGAVGLGMAQPGAEGPNVVDAGLDVARRASGGRLLEDEYPTKYLPNVGRQVMADGGEPTAQSRRRATLEQLGAFEDKPPMDPAVMGQNWASAVQRFRDRPMREGEATVRPLELGARDVIGGAIAGDGGITRGRIADIVVGSRGLPGSGTLGMGVADVTPAGIPLAISDFSDALRNEDYLSAGLSAGLPAAYYARKPIMAAGRAVYDAGARAVGTARDVLGRVPAPVAAGGAGAAVMAPEDAEASKLNAVRRGLEAVRGIRAYHGSPHDFDRFDLSKIGTGEGAQAYGHGLYFAEAEPVAKGYRDKLTTDSLFTPTGDLFDPSSLRHMNMRVLARRNLEDLQPTIEQGKLWLSKIDQRNPELASMLRSDIDTLEQLAASGGVKKNPGRMYEVNIRANPEEFINFDAPFEAQPRRVQEVFGYLPPYSREGMDLARRIESRPFAEEAAAKGIPGIRYLDQGSRGAGEGSRNYVVFDDKLIDILRKYAKGGVAKELGSSPRETVKS